jgi:membrane protease YdiL (CAAX protease family)
LTSRPVLSGWSLLRAILGLFAFGLLGLSLTELAGSLLITAADWAGGDIAAWARDPATGLIFLGGIATALGFLIATLIVGRSVFGLTVVDLRWKGTGAPLRGTIVAFVVGVVLAGLVMLFGSLFGSARWVEDDGTAIMYAGRVGLLLLMLAPAALAEEIIFRGLPIVVLDKTLGRGMAVGIVALLFALAHWNNPSITTLSIGNICIAGLLLGVAFFAPGGLWTATGLHLGWNWALAALDAPVSGIDLRIPFIDYLPGQPAWLTGGSFGPEGGLLATIVLGIATVVAGKLVLGQEDRGPDSSDRTHG